MTEQAAKGVIRRLTVSIVAIVLLTAALTVTTFILVVSTVSTSGHPFSTGSVTLNLNDGKPIVSAGECTFAPGQSMERSFTVETSAPARCGIKSISAMSAERWRTRWMWKFATGTKCSQAGN